MRDRVLELKFQTHREYRLVRAGVAEYLQQTLQGLPEDQVILTEIALNEAVNNSFRHGTMKERGSCVLLKLAVVDGKKLVIKVKDNGGGFNANERLAMMREPNPEADSFGLLPDPLLESGRGIYLMWTAMNIIRYNSKGNEVTMVKLISS